MVRLQALKSRLGDTSDLEQTLNITPKLQSTKEDLVIVEGEDVKVSTGAQKLIEKCYQHTRASPRNSPGQKKTKVENVKIVSKRMVDGKEVLVEETVEYTAEETKEKQMAGSSFLSFKQKLKKEMMESKLQELQQRKEMMKINNEEGFEDELPEDEEVEDDETEDEEV